MQLFHRICIRRKEQPPALVLCICMIINETHFDSVIRIFSSVLLLYLGLAGELTGALAIMADILGAILLLTTVSLVFAHSMPYLAPIGESSKFSG